jgi:hypothetical protein
MNSTTKYILLALGGGATVILIVFLVNRMRRMQAAKRLRNQELTNEMFLIQDNTINGTPDWNNSKVVVSIAFGPLTWTGEINPTTNKSETRGDQEIKITGGAQSAKIELISKGTTLKTAEIDFYNEKLNGFN